MVRAWAPRREHLLLVAGIVAVAAVRLYFCTRLPVNTGDVLRHLFHSLFALRYSLHTAGTPLAELSPGLANVSWAHFPYNYPPLALGFFILVAAASPTIYATKVILTCVEALNASLIARVTGNRWAGLIYWASPLSIWWVSGEAQFEPVQTVFMLASLALLRRSRPAAFALLALGVQVKLTAVLLLPWLVWTTWRQDPRALRPALVAFVLALSPTLIAAAYYPVLEVARGTFGTMVYNPYYWNVLDSGRFLWNPGWLVACNAVATYGALAVLARFAWRSQEPVAYVGAISFLALVKLSTLGQFWYMLLFPAFAMAIPERRVRFWMIALTPLLDVHSLTELIVGAWGWTMGDYYSGLSVFTPFGVR